MAGEPSADRSWRGSGSSSRRAARRRRPLIGRVTRRHRREASTLSSPADSISLWALGASRYRAAAPGCARRPELSEHQREQYIRRRLVKIFTSTTGAWGVRPRPYGAAPGVRATAALVGSRTASAPRAVCGRLAGHRKRPSAPAPAQKTGLPKRKPTLPLTPREVSLSHAHLCRRKTGAQTRRHRNA